MNYVAKKNNLQFGQDVKQLAVGNSTSFTDYLENNLNKTQYGIVFCIDSMEFLNISMPCRFEFINKTFHLYTILYNVTNVPNGFLTSQSMPFPKDPKLSKLKLDMDNAFLEFYSNKTGRVKPPEIKLDLESYPSIQNRFLEKADVVSSTGAFYFFFPPMICFVVILLEIIREKDLKLRKVIFILHIIVYVRVY
jgi:hypothetical protein